MMTNRPTMSEEAKRLLNEFRYEVLRDSWNLTRLDHDAIELKIDQLEEFIKQRYTNHGTK